MTVARLKSASDVLRNGGVDAVMLDIDGTLTLRGKRRETAAGFLALLRSKRIPFVCVSNDSSQTAVEKAASLRRLGLTIEPDEIVLCHSPFQGWITAEGLRGPLMAVGFGDPRWLEQIGVPLAFGLENIARAQAIVLGGGDHPWQASIEGIVNHLRENPHVPIVVPNPDSCCPRDDGGLSIDAGAVARWIASLLAELGIQARIVFLGKPFSPIYEMALDRLKRLRRHGGVRKSRVLAIGDSVQSDIAGGRAMGFQTALILGAITREDSLRCLAPSQLPNFVVDEL
jgi:4-nitrophenyl phosphatase